MRMNKEQMCDCHAFVLKIVLVILINERAVNYSAWRRIKRVTKYPRIIRTISYSPIKQNPSRIDLPEMIIVVFTSN